MIITYATQLEQTPSHYIYIIIMITHRATIDDFSMLTAIGKGAFAEVYLVKHNQTKKIYAMKIIPKKNVSAKKQQSFIAIERNVLVQTNHPFIIKMLYSFQNSKKLFFVLEYCHGGELYRQITKKHKLPEDHVRFYAAQMVLALQYLHSKNIVYRDLKPENVLIDKKGYLRLTDFGLSDMKEDVITNQGTFQYLAPEVLNKQVSGKGVDWWCLGNIVFEMATGLPPFFANSREQVTEKILNGEPNYPNNISQKLKQIIVKLLIKDPNLRLGSKGSGEIKCDPWFSKIDWKGIQSKKVQPPYIPYIESQTDTSNFDLQLGEETNSYYEDKKSIQQQFEYFRDFSFENKFTVVDVQIKDESDSDSDDIQFQMSMDA